MISVHPCDKSTSLRVIVSAAVLMCSWFVLGGGCLAENAVSLGYGFGMWNGSGTGHIEGRRSYNYATFSYMHEKALTDKIAFVLEPFLNVVNKPDTGLDLGGNLHLKSYVAELSKRRRVYVIGGAGAAYTTIGFKEQGTHGLFNLQGGIGYRHDPVFVDIRFNHYSNGGLASPNRSVNSTVIKMGYYFESLFE
jgi:hypothetical protein